MDGRAPNSPTGTAGESPVRDDIDASDPTEIVAHEVTDNVIFVDFRRD